MSAPLRLWLDDERPAPDGWVVCRWPDDMIRLLIDNREPGQIERISLDHDLGDDVRGTGYDVLVWIERAVYHNGYTPPAIQLHTANPAAMVRMRAAVDAIWRLHDLMARTRVALPGGTR